jgi:hypothetical protein
MWKALTKFVLFDDQKHHITILTLFLFHRRFKLPLNITTGDDFLIYTWDMEMKHLHPSSLHPKKAHQVQ